MQLLPKYSITENERRWLVDSSYAGELEGLPYLQIRDRYLDGSRMRLRSLTNSLTGKIEYKLCKKYGAVSEVSEPITNIYLTESEYQLFQNLPGAEILKSRYKQEIGGQALSIDVFEGHLSGLVICEIEMSNEKHLRLVTQPQIATREITREPKLQGGTLCRMGALELYHLLNDVTYN